MVLAVIQNAGEGQLTVSGLLVIAVIIAIVRDAQIRKQVSQAATPDNSSPTTAPTITRGTRVNPMLVQVLGGLVGFLVVSYAVREGMRWYRETTYVGDTPYERSFVRALRAEGGYEGMLSLAKKAGDARQVQTTAALTVQRGIALLDADDQAKRVEVIDGYLASAPAAVCAAFGKGSGDRETLFNGMLSSLDSVALDVFTHLVAKAFVAATQNPSYRPPELSQDEMVQFLRDVSSGLPQAERIRFVQALCFVQTTATDLDVCWATRTMYRYALGQQGERRTTALRFVTLLEVQGQR